MKTLKMAIFCKINYRSHIQNHLFDFRGIYAIIINQKSTLDRIDIWVENIKILLFFTPQVCANFIKIVLVR